MQRDVSWVRDHLRWMREQRIWPNGLRYLWTDAFGVVLLVSLYYELGEDRWLGEAKQVVADVESVLGRPRGIRIGEAPDRDGQYFHYLAMWMYALYRLGEVEPEYRRKGIDLVRQVHPAFVVPDTGVWWKMQEDLSGPYPGYGFGGLDAFQGYVVYRLLDPEGLSTEIEQMKRIVEKSWRDLVITQDLGTGMMLWMSHFFPDERWARVQKDRCLTVLDRMWIDPPGYFCRQPGYPEIRFAFTNYGVSVGLQAVDAWEERVERLNRYFETWRSGDEYDTEAITHVMACNSRFPGALLKTGDRAAVSR
ncbi:MAG TPA: hypothetical protein VF756_07340 [Thermoanaerobaculia bacterium]